jgi:hypothetical protein
MAKLLCIRGGVAADANGAGHDSLSFAATAN